MSLSDIFTNFDFSTTELSVLTIATTLIIAFLLGLFIFTVYRFSYQGVMYSKTFNISLIGLAMITSAIILAISSNIILSLGMVGALSIVRFRTAIKDPIDVVYMFWAIAAGIITGAGLLPLAIIFTLVVGIILYSFSRISSPSDPYLLVIEYADDVVEKDVYKAVRSRCKRYKIKSKTKGDTMFELTLELRSNRDMSGLVNAIDRFPGVKNTALLSYDGNFVV